jgi:hypothetical protein
MVEPILLPIKNGWLAVSPVERWGTDAPTREEAIERFRQAERRHREIDTRLFCYETQQPEGNSGIEIVLNA